MPTRWTIAALCVLLGALAAHARILDVRGVGADDDDPTAPPATESTAVPPTTPSSNVDPYCLTCDGVNHQRYQLIRGEGEVDKCKKQIYCDCIEHTQKKCGWLHALNPDKQECAMWFSCESWLNQHTSTTAPPTSTAPTGPQPTVTEPTVPPPTATASTATPTIAPAPTATSTIAPAPTVTQTTPTPPTRPPTAAPQTGTPGPQTTTGSPGNQTTTVSPGTQKTSVTSGPPPTPVPVPATTPSSAWANKATALTIVCLAAVIAL